MILKTGFTPDSMASVPSEEDNLDSSTKSGKSQISSDIREITSDSMASVPLEEDKLDFPSKKGKGISTKDKLDSSTKPGISLSLSQSLLFCVCKIG